MRALALVLALCAGATVAVADAPEKSSPYVAANKRHVDPKTGKHQPTMKRAAANGRGRTSPGRRKY